LSFAAKTNDWRRLPPEARELLLGALQLKSAAISGRRLSPLELAEQAGIIPDPWQRDLLTSQAQQTILLCSRQSGKSTVSALLGLHQALYTPNSLVLLLSPSQRQSQELFRKVKDFYASLPAKTELAQESALRLEFHNNSRIIVLPGKEATVRGFSGVSLLIVDEAARVEDQLYFSIRPMLAVSQGRIILLSTPFGSRGFFWKEYTEGEGWQRVRVTATECPRIASDWLAKERERIGSWWFDQEYLCKFVDSLDQIFSSEDIMRAISHKVKPLWT
jgi:hypothetical protein